MASPGYKLCVLLFVVLYCATNGQQMGYGLAKYTRGQSDPRACLRFFEKYLNSVESPDDCANGQCECATQGRGNTYPMGHRFVSSFGIHAINCTYHPYGKYSLADIEEMQTAEVNDFKGEYNQHLDSHLGLWVSDLNETIELLEKDKIMYYGMTWKEVDKSYYSVMTMACGGFYVELLSHKATGIESHKFHETKEIRYSFSQFSHPSQER